MSVRYIVRHETLYSYEDLVPQAQTEARVQPRDMPWQRELSGEVTLRPASNDRRERVDFFGNRVLYYSVQESHTEATIISEFEVELLPEQRPVATSCTLNWRDLARETNNPHATWLFEARPWIYESPLLDLEAKIHRYAREVLSGFDALIPACAALMTRIFDDFTYDAEATEVDTPVDDALEQKAGVCQDFAHVMLSGLRSNCIPCRYVSGYLETLPPLGQEKLVGADATHAWVSVFVPELGWVDFDPTNNLLPYDQHITLGWGRDFSDVIPVKGLVVGGDRQRIDVQVDVLKSDQSSTT